MDANGGYAQWTSTSQNTWSSDRLKGDKEKRQLKNISWGTSIFTFNNG